MEAIRTDSSSARLIAAALETPFTVIDVGCSGGLDPGWAIFGDQLQAVGFDPSRHEIERLTAAERRPLVRYVQGFVGLPPGDPAKGASIDPWRLDPWGRLSAYRTQVLQQSRALAPATARPQTDAADQADLMARNLWREAELADPDKPIVLPQFLADQGLDDVDFIKIDVDGTDFEILQSLGDRLADPGLLGAGLEVNFFGSDHPQVNTFHNIDRLMRANGFDLFDLSVRRYSLAALPRPFLYPQPLASQTTAGRPFQGDALYLRDLGYPHAGRDLSVWADDKLLKLTALFALMGLLDQAAELLLLCRNRLGGRLDVDALLDQLTKESQDSDAVLWQGRRLAGYRDYIAAYEADDPAFYGAADRLSALAGPDVDADGQFQVQRLEEGLHERDLALAKARRDLEDARHLASETGRKLQQMERSLSWKLTAPLRTLRGR